MSRRHGPVPRSSLTQNGEIRVRGPKGRAPVFHSGTMQRPPSATRTIRGEAAGRRTKQWPPTAAIASNLNGVGHPTSANATPSSTCNENHHTQSKRDRSRFRTNAGANAPNELGGGGIGWSTAPQKIRVQHRVRQLQNALEHRHFRGCEAGPAAIDEADQEGVELPHAAPAPPTEPRDFGFHRLRTGAPRSFS